MSLEVESGISMRGISSVLSKFGAKISVDGDGVSGNFEGSNAYFVFRECHGFEEVVTEEINVSWGVGVRGAFHCPGNLLAESYDDIKRFLSFLAERESCRFILSFQYESIYAIRDEAGLRFIKEMVG
ncbi:hypothetical protein K5Q02_11110 [Pseudomonas sp. MM211]|uniref:hypothetical protein n=1 Tax=Pseudomonas sp. MM211 TaxID=2866808 RepID=UPI001CECD90E|nr:hypothetical protein [Pseudomonas sp. MM211]UCJ18871.1 hypothetical protein K5Q02_11110 [Pseudomonas sp. MM211]